MTNFEAIYAALFSTLTSSAGFTTASRRLQHWSDVDGIKQPALYMAQLSENAMRRQGQPTKWTLRVRLYVYVQEPDETQSPAPLLNGLLGNIRAAMEPSGADLTTGNNTLGGQVTNAWIDGNIETDEGVLGSQAVALVPITILYASP